MKPKSNLASATDALATLLGDELLAMSDEDLDAALRDLSVEPAQAVERGDAAFKTALKMRSAQRLAEARRQRENEITRLKSGAAEAALSRDDLYILVQERFAAMQVRQGTLMHRDFEKDTTEDLLSLLRQLDALEKPKTR